MSGFAEIDLKASARFLADVRRLPDAQARKLDGTVRLLRENDVTYGSLKTRPIERNADPRFRLMNIDDEYRIVAAVEGRHAGVGTVPLEEYRGRAAPGVKVGTYHRAKGLKFKRRFLPGLDDTFPRGDGNDADELIEAGSLLYVAMGRARDELNLSYVGCPSMFIDAVLPVVYPESEGALA